MTYLQLRNAVIDNSNRSDKVGVINNGINFALAEAAKRHQWYSLRGALALTVNSGDISVNMPVDFYRLIEIRLINPAATALSYSMRVVPKGQFLRRFPNVNGLSTGGRPMLGYEENGVFYFAPKSSATYSISGTYQKNFPVLVNDGDASPIVELDLFIIAFSTAYLFKSIQMFDAAGNWMQDANSLLDNAIKSEKNRPGTTYSMEEFSQPYNGSDGSPEPWSDPFAGRETGFDGSL